LKELPPKEMTLDHVLGLTSPLYISKLPTASYIRRSL